MPSANWWNNGWEKLESRWPARALVQQDRNLLNVGDNQETKKVTGSLQPTTPSTPEIAVALLTGGGDQPYAYGLATELISQSVILDIIGSNELDCPEFHGRPRVNFLNLRGDQRPDVSFISKTLRLSSYYLRLLYYAATATPKVFHILWNNKFETFDRTLLMLYYKALAKKVVLTVHNVNVRKRDDRDSALNRFTLRVQYRLSDHIFVHTEQMKRELIQDFGAHNDRVSVIPFGINNAVRSTNLTEREARTRLNLRDGDKTLLFFGNIAPYKGLELLVSAFQQLSNRGDNYRLIIAGRPKNCEQYWSTVREMMREDLQAGRIVLRDEFIPDDETEIFFKAADVLVLPYRHIYQSGVLFLGYSFGLPTLAADVGSLKDDIEAGRTGFIFKAEDPGDLARVIQEYFASDLYRELATRRTDIKTFAAEKHSWSVVGKETAAVYAGLLHLPYPSALISGEESSAG